MVLVALFITTFAFSEDDEYYKVITLGPEYSIENTNPYYYIVTFEVSQSHLTFDITEHLKDKVNKMTIEIPVDLDYYKSVKVGEEISSNFRVGSLVFKGTIGKWKIKVVDKKIIKK